VVTLFHQMPNGDWDDVAMFTTSLKPKAAVAGQSFGFSVAIDGGYVVVGAPFGGANGTVQVFEDLSWSGNAVGQHVQQRHRRRSVRLGGGH
jgi:hypothetical protein